MPYGPQKILSIQRDGSSSLCNSVFIENLSLSPLFVSQQRALSCFFGSTSAGPCLFILKWLLLRQEHQQREEARKDCGKTHTHRFWMIPGHCCTVSCTGIMYYHVVFQRIWFRAGSACACFCSFDSMDHFCSKPGDSRTVKPFD